MKTHLSILPRVLFVCLFASSLLHAQATQDSPLEVYKQLRAFKLGGSIARVENFKFERDRLKMTLNGDIYFAEPVDGTVTGAVFLGRGDLHADAWNISE